MSLYHWLKNKLKKQSGSQGITNPDAPPDEHGKDTQCGGDSASAGEEGPQQGCVSASPHSLQAQSAG